MEAHKQLNKLNQYSTVSALVLTVALLCGIVGLGLYSVMAEPNGGYKVSDLDRMPADFSSSTISGQISSCRFLYSSRLPGLMRPIHA